MAQKKTKSAAPDFIAYHVPERKNAKWNRIGAAWGHEDGKGYTVQLDLMPVASGRIVLRKFEPQQDGQEAQGEGA